MSVEKKSTGEALFLSGSAALREKNYISAREKLLAALEQGYAKAGVYFNLAVCAEAAGELTEAGQNYGKAIDVAEGDEVPRAQMGAAEFNFRTGQVKRAAELSQILMQNERVGYRPYHLYCAACSQLKKPAEAEEMLKEVEGRFAREPDYWKDRLKIMDLQFHFSSALKLIEEKREIMELIPRDAMRLKVKILVMLKDRGRAEEAIREYFERCGTIEAGFLKMLLDTGRENYEEALGVAVSILQAQEKNRGLMFYLALYYTVFLGCKCSDGELDNGTREDFLKSILICEKWFTEKRLMSEEMLQSFSDAKKYLAGVAK